MIKNILGKNRAFTLLELIIALALLAILSSMAVSKFVDLRCKTLNIQERATIKSARTGLLLEHTRRILEGINPAWPDENPFNFVENPPPNVVATPSEGTSHQADGVHWYVSQWTSAPKWVIWCPHCSESSCPGYLWYYYHEDHQEGPVFYQAGTITLHNTVGHCQ